MNGPGPRIRQGDDILLSIASAVPLLKVAARIDYLGDDGIDYTLTVPQFTAAGDRTTANFPSGSKAPVDGWVHSAYVSHQATLIRGEAIANLQLRLGGGHITTELCKGYLTPMTGLALGEYGIRGPAGGHGALKVLTLADDVAGNVDTTVPLLAVNTYRIVYGVALYYNASGDVADRVPAIDVLGQPWGALPTGFAVVTPLAWTFTGPTTSANEEGFMWAYNSGRGDGYQIIQDNGGGLTPSNTTTAPCPFPYIVQEVDPIDIRLRIGAGVAADRYSAYALIEEWVMG